MRKALFMLIFILICNIAYSQAQTQFPLISKPELPQDYKTWQGKSEKLTIRNNLIAEKEAWGLVDDQTEETSKMLMILRLNDVIVYTMLLESRSVPLPDDPDNTEVIVTLNWLVKEGYLKLSESVRQPTTGLEKKVNLVWIMWEEFIRYKFIINNKEMVQLEEFFPL